MHRGCLCHQFPVLLRHRRHSPLVYQRLASAHRRGLQALTSDWLSLTIRAAEKA
jgi:hypothetical protein